MVNSLTLETINCYKIYSAKQYSTSVIIFEEMLTLLTVSFQESPKILFLENHLDLSKIIQVGARLKPPETFRY